jgi:TolB-like protein/Tfp pilus assembly protein PilF
MALVFTSSSEAPVECALQISRTVRAHPHLPVRMGIHSGPVHEVDDVNGRANIAGAGINLAQRVMDCGDAGHILLSKRVADDLAQYRHWESCLHQLGDCEVKHELMLPLVNIHGEGFGNPAIPKKLRAATENRRAPSSRVKWVAAVAAGVAIAAVVLLVAAKQNLPRDPAPAPPGAGPEAAVNVPAKSIAVLPFDNLSRDPDNAFFVDGVHDEILTHLAKIADLKVISRTSVMQYKSGTPRNPREIGQQLKVAHLLEGSVQRAGNKVRVIAQLVEAGGQDHLWAQTYDRDLADVFAIQSEIAKAIADQLQAKLSPKEKAAIEQPPTSDLVAFEHYSRARTLLVTGLTTSQDTRFREAVELLNSAVARDPLFYAAFCQLVFVNDSLYSRGFDRTPARLAAAEAALQRAVQLRPDAPETHLARGWHLYYGSRDYAAALAELEIAGRGLPNDPRVLEATGYILRRQGKDEDGLRALEQAVARDPRNVFILAQLVLSYQMLRRYAEEAEILSRILEITPDDLAVATSRAGVDLLRRADTRPLRELIEKLRAQNAANMADAAPDWLICALADRDWRSAEQALVALGDTPFMVDWSIRLTRKFGEGLLARARNDEAAARVAFTAARTEQEEIVRQQVDYGAAVCVLGMIEAALGNKEAAVKAAQRAIELTPVEKDPNDGYRMIAYAAIIMAWAGEKERALESLAASAPKPGGSTIASYGMLKLTPFWDPLRDDPRFEEIAASFAPAD